MLTYQVSLVSLLILLAGCSSYPKSPERPLEVPQHSEANCLDDELVRNGVGAALAVWKRAGVTDPKATFVEDACWKRVYRFGNNSIISYRDSVRPDGVHTVSVVGPRKSPKEALACAEEAFALLNQIADPAMDHILVKRKRDDYNWQWTDPDVGPSFWLSCHETGSPLFNYSVANMLHELNHEMQRRNCIYFAHLKSPSYLCFDFPQTLPSLANAKLANVGAEEKFAEILKEIERVYLYGNGDQLARLLDEVYSYSLTTDVWAGVLRLKGPTALFATNNVDRNYLVLPQIMAHVMVYLKYLKKTDPILFRATFFEGSQNLQFLNLVLDNAERAYLSMKAQLAFSGYQPWAIEENCFKTFKSLRASLGI